MKIPNWRIILRPVCWIKGHNQADVIIDNSAEAFCMRCDKEWPLYEHSIPIGPDSYEVQYVEIEECSFCLNIGIQDGCKRCRRRFNATI